MAWPLWILEELVMAVLSSSLLAQSNLFHAVLDFSILTDGNHRLTALKHSFLLRFF